MNWKPFHKIVCPPLVASIAFGALACSSAPRITSVDDLIAQLLNAGVQIDSQQPAPKPTSDRFRFDEAIRVKGPGLFVDVLRIEDRRVFDIAKSAGRMLVVAEASAGQHIPDNPSVFARYPFVIIIRAQPEAAPLEPILGRLLPPESN